MTEFDQRLMGKTDSKYKNKEMNKSNNNSKIFLLGISIGDPALSSKLAQKVINDSDVIVIPQGLLKKGLFHSRAQEMAESMLEELMNDKIIIRSSLSNLGDRDKTDTILEIKKQLSEGLNICYLCLGDPSFYSSARYIYQAFSKDFSIEIIPAITSFQYAFSLSQTMSLTDKTSLIIVPAHNNQSSINQFFKLADCEIVFIKLSSHFKKIFCLIEANNLIKSSYYFQNLGLNNQSFQPLSDLDINHKPPYFSIIHTINKARD